MKNELFQQERNVLAQAILLLENALQFIISKQNKKSPFYDSADLKCYLHVSDKTLQRWRKQGKIPFQKVGKKYFYPRSFFEGWLKDGKTGG